MIPYKKILLIGGVLVLGWAGSAYANAEISEPVGSEVSSSTNPLPSVPDSNPASEVLSQPSSEIPLEDTTPQQPELQSEPQPEPQSEPQPEPQPESELVPSELLQPADSLELPTKPEEVAIQREVPISLQQAIDIAERNSQQLQLAILRLDQSQAQVREAQSALFPTLSLQGNLNRELTASGQISVDVQRDQLEQSIRGGRVQIAALETQLQQPFDLNDPQQLLQFGSLSQQLQQGRASLNDAETSLSNLANYATLQISGGIGLNYTVFSASRGPLIEASRQSVRFNELEVERTRKQLRLDTATVYYQLQQADQQIRIEEASVRESSRSFSDSQALASAGLATRLDVLNSEVQLGDAQQRLVRARSQQQAVRRQLARLLNLPSTITPVTADSVERVGTWDLTLPESITLAFQSREELEQLLAQRSAALAQRRASLGSLWPQLSLFANYSVLQLDTDNPDKFAVKGFGDGYQVGVSLQWNFWDGGAATARARQRQLDALIAEVSFSDRRDAIRLEVEQAYFDLQSNDSNIQTATLTLRRAEEALRLARLRFQAAVGTQTDVLDAETRLTQAQSNLLQAVLGYNLSLARLQRAVGNFPQSAETNQR